MEWVKFRPDNAPQYGYLIAYDKSAQKVALLSGDLELWYFDGKSWVKDWEGIPDTDYDNLYYYGALGIFYDDRISALVLIAHIGSPTQMGGIELLRYTADKHWVRYGDFLAGALPPGAADQLALAYDSTHQSVVMIVDYWPDGNATVVYDGTNYSINLNPPDIYLSWGFAAYDPESDKVVFYGSDSFSTDNINVYEYDGRTWTQTLNQPSCQGTSENHCAPAGLAYDPILHGIVSITQSVESALTWLYINNLWMPINVESNLPHWGGALMTFNYCNGYLLNYYPTLGSDFIIYNTWKLKESNHCRPINKP